MKKLMKKWALESRRGKIIVFESKPVKDVFIDNGKEIKSGYWVFDNNFYPIKNWKLCQVEVKKCK